MLRRRPSPIRDGKDAPLTGPAAAARGTCVRIGLAAAEPVQQQVSRGRRFLSKKRRVVTAAGHVSEVPGAVGIRGGPRGGGERLTATRGRRPPGRGGRRRRPRPG